VGLCEILPLPGVQAAQPRHLDLFVHYRFVSSLQYKVVADFIWKNEQDTVFSIKEITCPTA